MHLSRINLGSSATGVQPSMELFQYFFTPYRSGSLAPLALALSANPAPSVGSSSGGAAQASFPLPGRTSGRTGRSIGCTSRWATLPCFSDFLKALRRATPGGPRRQCKARRGCQCWSDSTRSGRLASPQPWWPPTYSADVWLCCRPALIQRGVTLVTTTPDICRTAWSSAQTPQQWRSG